MDKVIQIKCKGATEVSLDELVVLQGNLKELSEENYTKLHDLIVSKGFDSPIQIWEDPNGIKQILDGTQRVRVLLKLREEGYTIPLIPADIIYAENKKDAKERLLTKVSQYGEVTEEGLYEFTNEEDSIIEPDFSELLDIPGMDFNKDDVEVKADTLNAPSEPKQITCPNCQHTFIPEK